MQAEYDFSKGVRGKFYVPNDEFEYPIYLEQSVQEYFFDLAEKEKKDPSDLISEALKKSMAS